MNICNDCGTVLRRGQRCGCNGSTTKDNRAPAVHVPCEQLGCDEPAIARIKDGYITRPMCRTHYDRYFQQQASDYARGLGLDTTEKKRAYCTRLLKEIGTKEGSRDWAYSLKTDYLDGVALDFIQIQMASAALNEQWLVANNGGQDDDLQPV